MGPNHPFLSGPAIRRRDFVAGTVGSPAWCGWTKMSAFQMHKGAHHRDVRLEEGWHLEPCARGSTGEIAERLSSNTTPGSLLR